MMCRIAICDDREADRKTVKTEAETTFLSMGIACQFSMFESGEALLQAMATEQFDLVMMEIEMPGKDGVETGRQLRVKGYHTCIVYVSYREERVFDVFQVQPLGFVRKSKLRQDMIQVARQYQVKMLNSSDGDIVLETRTGRVVMDIGKIRYIEGRGNYQMVYLAGEAAPVELKMTMDRLEEDLRTYHFLRIHRGYLVNPRYVTRITYDFAFLSNGLRLPVGQSRARLVRQQYLRQQENRA